MTPYRFKDLPTGDEQQKAEIAFEEALANTLGEQPPHPAINDTDIGAPNQGSTEALDEE